MSAYAVAETPNSTPGRSAYIKEMPVLLGFLHRVAESTPCSSRCKC